MAQRQLNLIYALKSEKIVHISEVESGLKCDCICPACGAQLVAKKGSKMAHHFAHHAGENCEYGYESSLHLAAKDILSKAKKMVIPPVYVVFPDSYKKKELVCEAKEIPIDHVELEKRYGGVVPDIIVYTGNKQFFVEIYVTHAIDATKLKKLQSANISTIEIDLSKKDSTTSAEELTDILLRDSEEKAWKYNVVANEYLQRFYQAGDSREPIAHGFSWRIDNCPIKSRVWRGKPYANYIDDCLYCPYCISTSSGSSLLCSGRLRIATIADFNIPIEKRIMDSDAKIESEKTEKFSEGICPNCGGDLIERQGKYGTFLGCRNYPHCRFTASLDPTTGEIIMKA